MYSIIILYSVYYVLTWILFSKLIEKFRQPFQKNWPLYIFMGGHPILMSFILRSAAAYFGFEADANWIVFSSTVGESFLIGHFMAWSFGTLSLQLKNKIAFPKISSSRFLNEAIANNPSAVAMYFATEGTLLVCLVFPWASF